MGKIEQYQFNPEKNSHLKDERGIGFEDVMLAISEGNVLDVIGNPNTEKYPNEKALIVIIKNYVYVVPFVRKRKYSLSQDYISQQEDDQKVH